MEWLVAGRVCTRTLVTRSFTRSPLSRNYAATVVQHTPINKKYPTQPAGEPTPLRTHQDHLTELSKQLRFPLKHVTPNIYKEAYQQPLGGTENLPFRFTRTVSNRLPIYTDFKQKDVKKEYTVVRKINGDVNVLFKYAVKLCLFSNKRCRS